MLKKLCAASLALAVAVSATTADAAMTAYMKIKSKSGFINGSVIQRGREGSMLVFSSSHEIISPRDAATGMATGKRQHKPFVVTKEIDKASPLLYKALTTNDTLPEVELRFWRTGAGVTGGEQQFYTVKLVNATISQIRFVQPSTQQADTQRLAEYEEISFTYQRIEWTWMEGNVTAVDDWLAPR